MGPTKDTNPKDIIGSGKLPLSLVPASMNAYAALAFLEGALKYGRFNWRIAGVRCSVYLDAALRHLSKFANGEYCDSDRVNEDGEIVTGTKVPHLASALACIAIILDADLCGKLNDDRAPAQENLGNFIDTQCAYTVAHLKELFADRDPHQYTIADTELPEAPIPFIPVDMGEPVSSSHAFGRCPQNVYGCDGNCPPSIDPTPPESYTEAKSWDGAEEYDAPDYDAPDSPDTQRSQPPEAQAKPLPAWRYDVKGIEIKLGDLVTSAKVFCLAGRSEVTEIARDRFVLGHNGSWENSYDRKPHLRVIT